MKIEKKMWDYISGDKFSNGVFLPISGPEKSVNTRIEMIESLVEGKRVIHLGCCDHIPLIKMKMAKNMWLHKRITEKASECIGIDIDQEAIDFVKKEIGFNNVECADITKPGIQALTNSKWDYMIVGEILEHVDNPVQFLSDIKASYGRNIDKIIVTVPNAFSGANVSYAKKGIEAINSDHRYWFSPYTLAKIGFRAGLVLQEFFFVQERFYNEMGRRHKILVIPYLRMKLKNRKVMNQPNLREGLMGIFSVNE